MAVIDEVQPTGVTTAINLADCKSLLDSSGKDPYHLCFQYLLVEIARKAVSCPEGEEVAFILDERAKVTGAAQKLRLLVKDWRKFECCNRIGALAFHSSLKIVPLQAADWFANETYKAMFNQLEGDKPQQKRKPLELLEKHIVTSQYFYQDNLQRLHVTIKFEQRAADGLEQVIADAIAQGAADYGSQGTDRRYQPGAPPRRQHHGDQ